MPIGDALTLLIMTGRLPAIIGTTGISAKG